MAAGDERGYDAFISYSHRLDAAITARLQAELQRFAKPWYRMRALHVFRDQTSLAASPNLWTTIEEALADSGWLILMASPESAQSGWVAREISWWRGHRPMNHLLIAVTGESWSGTRPRRPGLGRHHRAVQGGGRARVHPGAALGGPALGPRPGRQPPAADPRLQDAVADLAAAIRHVPKDSLIGEHIQHRRRTLQAAIAVGAALVVLLAFSLTAAFVAKGQRDRADQENIVATAGLLASTADSLTGSRPDLAQLFAVQAYRLDPGNPQARAALFATVQADPQVQRFLLAPGPLSALASLARRSYAVAGTRNGWVRGWSLSTSRRSPTAGWPGRSARVAVSADGTTVAAATSRAARTWVRGRLVATRSAPPGTPFTAAGISPSGTFAAFAAFPDLEVLSTAGRSWRQARLHGFGTWHRGRPPLVTNLAVPSDTGLVALDGRYGSWRRLALPGLTPAGSARNTFGPSRYPAYTYALSPGGTLFTHSYVAAGSSLRVLSTRAPGPAPPPARRVPGAAWPWPWPSAGTAGGSRPRTPAASTCPASPGRAAQAQPPRSFPGAEPLFSTALAFIGGSDTRLISASGNLLTLWNLRSTHASAGPPGSPCPGGAAGSAPAPGWPSGPAAGKPP